MEVPSQDYANTSQDSNYSVANIFQQLQALADYENRNVATSLEEDRLLMTDIVTFFKTQEWQDSYTQWFADLRQLKKETLLEADAFMYDPDLPDLDIPLEFKADRLGLFKKGYSVFNGRFVYPVKDVRNRVAGFVGYDKFEAPKYVDSRNIGYISKATMLYGMEKMFSYYTSGKVFVTEGVVDTLFLRENNFPALASLGSSLSPYVTQILKRFGRNCVFIVDSDSAGEKYKNQVHRNLPEARVVQTTFANDLDEQRLISPELSAQTLLDLTTLLTSPYNKLETLRRI